ncbi:MAG: MFS transporter [Parvibaculum sp.]|uniref:MFS transporter n=1 Tax=Parvibaculum sp. TaxID=2024848 RepID=UPI00283E6DCF|nr:MFS transporter [Parvibaculum sp.]MDR3498636.1 MFS transporter [Parvibaculum sp.]
MNEARAGVFYGWYVVAATMAVMTVASGLGFYNLSVYLNAFVSHGGFSVSAASGATACFFIASGIAGLAVGALIERFDVRWVLTAGALICSLAMFASGHVNALWQLYGFYVLFGVGYACCALIPGTTLVARWFARRRSLALSVASTGLSLGGILLTPLSARLIAHLGFAGAAPWFALVFMLGIVPIAWLAIRPSPYAIGLGMDGDPIDLDASGQLRPADGIDYADAIRSRFFILMTLAFIFAMMAQVGAISHQFNLVAGRSGSESTAGLAVAVMAGASIVGRLAGGWALAYISSRYFVLALSVGQGAALILFAFAQGKVLLVVSALFGCTVGNLLMMQPLMLAEAFGLKAYGRVFSFNQLFMVTGVASGPAVMGLLYARAGNYENAYLVMAGASLLAFGLIWAAGPVRALIDGRQNA